MTWAAGYAVLCWLSVGGRIPDLVHLWHTADEHLTPHQRLVLGVLKEKTGIGVAADAARFVEMTTSVAAAARMVTA